MAHGYVYKHISRHSVRVAGKRILCSNRYGHQGCGRTRQLYLADIIPRYHYTLSVVVAFIRAMLAGMPVEPAYLHAIDEANRTTKAPRHAWRWVRELYKQLGRWRTHLAKFTLPNGSFHYSGQSRCLCHILPTLSALMMSQERGWLSTYQHQFQRHFM